MRIASGDWDSLLRRSSMKKLLAIAALLLASTAAQAQYTFEYGGRTIRIDPDRGTVQIPGVYDNTGKKAKRSRGEDGDLTTVQEVAAAGEDRPAGRARACGNPGSPAPAEQAAAPAPLQRRLSRPLRCAGEPSTATAAVAPAMRRASHRTCAAALPPPQSRNAARAAPRLPRQRRRRRPETGRRPAASTAGRELAARRLADRGEGRQGADRSSAAPISAAIPSTRSRTRTASRF